MSEPENNPLKSFSDPGSARLQDAVRNVSLDLPPCRLIEERA